MNKSLLPLNIDSSTDCLEYSKALNFMNTYKKRPFGKEVNEKAFFKLITQYIHQKKKKGTFKVDETYFDELNGQYISYRKIFLNGIYLFEAILAEENSYQSWECSHI
mgnify:CR=1 FL=1